MIMQVVRCKAVEAELGEMADEFDLSYAKCFVMPAS